jgi:DNA-binding response OmpR family regulator
MAAPHRILYVGNDLTLFKSLSDALSDCQVVRCPGGRLFYTLIESNINYALLLFDDELPDITGVELAQLTRKIKHRATTPIVILSKDRTQGVAAGLLVEKSSDIGSIVETITARLQHSKT